MTLMLFLLSHSTQQKFFGFSSSLKSICCDPSCSHEKIEDDFSIVFVQPDGVERFGRQALFLLQVVGEQASLVADVVSRRQP